jgi:hypothetical protein
MGTETPQEFRDRAAECERKAAEVSAPEFRETLLYVASRWRELADEDEARLKPNKRMSVTPTPG